MAKIELPFESLLGKTLDKIQVDHENDEMLFYTKDGDVFKMHHEQDCCESVYIEDICGDIDDLVGMPLLLAEEVDDGGKGPICEDEESFTWTFYKLSTNRGSVTIRWYGSSNGYYSESVEFTQVGVGDVEKFILSAKLNKVSNYTLICGLEHELRDDPNKYRDYFEDDKDWYRKDIG